MKRRAFLQALGLGAGAVAVPAIADIVPEAEPEFKHQEYSKIIIIAPKFKRDAERLLRSVY